MDKYIGCLVGGLVGDCLGAPFDDQSDQEDEFDKNVKTFMGDVHKNTVIPGPTAGRNHKAAKGSLRGIYYYTDVTATTLCLAKSLARYRRLDPCDVARRMTNEYFENECLDAEYGDAVRDIFRKWKNGKCADIYEPAKEQFGGRGSYGSGAAIRTAPVTILYKDDVDKMIETTILQAKMTHAHPTGICAAVLQGLAIHDALHADPNETINGSRILDMLLERMEKMEETLDGFRPLCYKLHTARKMLYEAQYSDGQITLDPTEFVKVLGNDMTAQGSVVTAVFCYLAGENGTHLKIPYKSENPFVRTLVLALCCGGNADTIAAMSCSLSGARHGIRVIPTVFQRQCQSVDFVTRLSEIFATESACKKDL